MLNVYSTIVIDYLFVFVSWITITLTKIITPMTLAYNFWIIFLLQMKERSDHISLGYALMENAELYLGNVKRYLYNYN
jgi:hypothetical protein